jgi:hypothetical protein
MTANTSTSAQPRANIANSSHSQEKTGSSLSTIRDLVQLRVA